MSERESEFIKAIRQTLIKAGVIITTTIILGGGTFFLATKMKLSDHDRRLKSMELNSVPRTKYEGHIQLEEEKDVRIFEKLEGIEEDVREIRIDVKELR